MQKEELKILVTAEDQASKAIKGLGDTFEKHRKAIGVAMTAVGAAVVGAIGVSIKAYQAQEKAEARLEKIAKQVTGATDEQIDSFKKLASELQKVGVVGDEVLISGQSQLASFTKNADVVSLLSKDLADLAVAQYGTNVSQEQAIQTANLMGKALTGQLGALTRTGILVSDEYKKAFEEANTEHERAIVLSKIVADNYGGLNEAMRQTSEGAMQALKNDFGDMQEMIGGVFIPILIQLVNTIKPVFENMMKWAEANPELFKKIVLVIGIIGALMLVLGPVLLILPTITTAIGLLAGAFMFLISPVGLIILAIAAFIAILLLLWKYHEEIIAKVMEWWEILKENLEAAMLHIKSIFETQWNNIKGIFDNVTASITSAWNNTWEAAKNTVVSAFESIKNTIKGAINWIIDKINFFIEKANAIARGASKIPGVELSVIPTIPRLEKGGIVDKTGLAVVHKGEVFSGTKNQMGFGGVTFNITGNNISSDYDVERIGDIIMQKLNFNLRNY